MSATHTQPLQLYVIFSTLVVLWTGTFTGDAVGQGPAEFRSSVTAANCRFLGTRSCAAVACHGDAAAPGVAGQEFVYWLENDPHGNANRSLHSELGQQIMKALNIKLGDRGYQNCQACHDPYVNKPTVSAPPRISEAVGCEACHGPSESWVADHYKPYWQSLSAREKSQCGMIDTQNLVVRARLCATCHVGTADREVNHDIIAAGHPPLKFELAAYHEMLPKHWDAHGERLRNSDFELLLWGYGQLASAEAALSVLAARATRAAARQAAGEGESPNRSPRDDSGDFPHQTWPELAEYNCFSCHKDLIEPSWRQQRGYPGRLGMANWQTWYFALPLDATARAAGVNADLDSNVNAIRVLMESGYDSDPNIVAAAAQQAKQDISTVLDALALPPVERAVQQSLLSKMLANQGADDGYVRNWDKAVQTYLSLFALQRNSQIEEMPPAFGQVRESLAFPAAYDSPRSFSGPQSPTVQGTLEALLRALQAQEAGG